MKALIFNEKVVQLEQTPFEVHSSLIWLDAPEGCKVGWSCVNGVFSAPALPTQEQLSKAARQKRNGLLAATDWTQVADAPVDKATWAAYRQALRDVPAQEGFPWTVNWPTQPE